MWPNMHIRRQSQVVFVHFATPWDSDKRVGHAWRSVTHAWWRCKSWQTEDASWRVVLGASSFFVTQTHACAASRQKIHSAIPAKLAFVVATFPQRQNTSHITPQAFPVMSGSKTWPNVICTSGPKVFSRPNLVKVHVFLHVIRSILHIALSVLEYQ